MADTKDTASVRVTGISEEENKNKESIKENVPEYKKV